MSKAFYQYNTHGKQYAFLQDTAIAGVLGNSPAVVDTPRMPHKLKPGKIALRTGAATPFTYRHYTIDPVIADGFTAGDTLTINGVNYTVIGFDDEVNNGVSAY